MKKMFRLFILTAVAVLLVGLTQAVGTTSASATDTDGSRGHRDHVGQVAGSRPFIGQWNDPCMSDKERRSVKKGMRKVRVQKVVGSKGTVVARTKNRHTRRWVDCDSIEEPRLRRVCVTFKHKTGPRGVTVRRVVKKSYC